MAIFTCFFPPFNLFTNFLHSCKSTFFGVSPSFFNNLPEKFCSSNSNGTYNVRLTNPQNALIPGTIAIKIKGPSHLQKSVPSIIYTGPGTTIDLTQSESQILLAGDTTNDNKITIEDISNISRYYTDFSVAVDNNDTSMKSADITKDGTITIQDLALASINWSDLTVVGDQ